MAESTSTSSNTENRPSSEVKRPITFEQKQSTGNRWTDFRLAFQQIHFWDDLKRIGEIPCARSSLLSGIASGAGVGVIRGINVGPFVASNWAMGTFLIVSIGTWNVCRSAIKREREQVQVTMEKMAQRRVKREEGTNAEVS